MITLGGDVFLVLMDEIRDIQCIVYLEVCAPRAPCLYGAGHSVPKLVPTADLYVLTHENILHVS
jgi:hypothetical protein